MRTGCKARSPVLAALFVLSVLFPSSRAFAADPLSLPLFGPETFRKSSGIFFTRTFPVPSGNGNFHLRVVNGDGTGNDAANTATVLVNGLPAVYPWQLTKHVPSIDKQLSNLYKGTNSVVVIIGPFSSSSSYVTLRITGEYQLDIKITDPPAGAMIHAGQTAVGGTYASYTGDIAIAVNGIPAAFSDGTFTADNIPLAPGANTLVASIATGDGIQDNDAIVVSANNPPVADAGPDRHVMVGQRAFLDGKESYDPEEGLIAYDWSLLSSPAGSATSLEDNSFVISSLVPDLPGNYVVSLTVNDGTADSVPDNVTIMASHPNVAPTADAGRDRSVLTGNPVVLDGTGSSDPDSDPLAYSWQFLSLPSGSQAALSDSASPTPGFTADVGGEYVTSLTVHDGHQDSLPDSVTVVAAAPNPPPVAHAGTFRTASWRKDIHLNGSLSYDPAGDPLSYRWSVVSRPPDSESAFDDAFLPAPSILADQEGYFVFRLTVSDGVNESAPDTVVVASVNDPPVANAGPDQTVVRNTALTLDGSGSTDANGDALTYQWAIVSAPAGSTASIGNPFAVNPLFTPYLAGQYGIRLIVNDGKFDSAPDDMIITATPMSVPVPSVTGLLQEDVSNALAAAGFVLGTVTTAYSDIVPAGSVISQNPDGGSFALEGSPVDIVVSLGPQTVTVPDVTGLFEAAASAALSAAGLTLGMVTTEISPTVPAGNVIRQDPAGGTVVPPGTAVSLTVSLGGAPVTVPDLVGKPQGSAEAAIAAAGFTVGTVTTGFSDTVIPGGVASQVPPGGASSPQGSPVDLVISLGPAPVTLPPDPATVAPPVDPTVATTVKAAAEFLYTGPNPIQTGVMPDTIELRRAAVLRGIVTSVDNSPLPGVVVTILNHPEYGQTLTREDGMFDLAVNGGGLLTVDYRKGGYLPSQRQVNVPWQEYVVLPEVVLLSFDPMVTEIDLSSTAPVQVARGSLVTDTDGTRQATLLFAQGTQATMTMPDGTTRPLRTLNVRATEYTVGESGPKAMPAELPPNVGYTYCVELSVDEAVAVGATEVRFDRPVIQYVENFLNFPVGIDIPLGYFDREKGAWIPADSGRIVKIISITAGRADLDITGDSIADDPSALGITDEERERLATLYPAGTSLWRVKIPHFTPWDCNWPTSPPSDATFPPFPDPQGNKSKDDPDTCVREGSIVECENQVLGETLPVTGTTYTLNYRSNRVPGRGMPTWQIPLSGPNIPESLKRIELEIQIAGKQFFQSYPALPNQQGTFLWDGIDAYGRKLEGQQIMSVRAGYVYDALYGRTARFGRSGMQTIDGSVARQEFTFSQQTSLLVGGGTSFAARNQGLGSWTLNMHHAYEGDGVLYLGDGSSRTGDVIGHVIRTVLKSNSQIKHINNAVAGPDGSIYFVGYEYMPQWGNVEYVYRMTPNGAISPMAGGLEKIYDIAVGEDNSLYIQGQARTYMLKDGVVSVIAGKGATGSFCGDDIPATQTCFDWPGGIAVGPDKSIYIADTGNARIRKISPDGIITTVAGTGVHGYQGDGMPATQTALNVPRRVAVGADGSIYISDTWNNRIRRVRPDGIIETVAGNGWSSGPITDGAPATSVAIYRPTGLAVSKNGYVYVYDEGHYLVRRFVPGGRIWSVAGNGTPRTVVEGFPGDNGPAKQAPLYYPGYVPSADHGAIALGPDGNLYITETNQVFNGMDGVRVVAPPLVGLDEGENPIPSVDGKELYIFNSEFRHERTKNTLTGKIKHEFTRDDNGLLSQIIEDGAVTATIERGVNGVPTAIVAHGGQRTTLGLDAGGYLSHVTNPAGESYSMEYTPEGLLIGLTDPNGNRRNFVYDSSGRLERDEGPEGGFIALARSVWDNGYLVAVSTAEGRFTGYGKEFLPDDSAFRTVTNPAGAVTKMMTDGAGKSTLVVPDGTMTEIILGPDPRFGMESPIATSRRLTTPGGHQLTVSTNRSAVLVNPTDLLSLVSQTENTVVNGNTWSQVYTAATKQFTLSSPADRQSVTGIDAQGRVILLSPAPVVDNLLFIYDNVNRLSQVSQGSKTWTYGYDGLNRLTSVTDPLDNVVRYSYNNADRVSQVILPSGRTYGFGYDASGNRTSITMPSGAVHQLGYNKVNLDNAYLPPGNPAYATSYDLDREWVRTTLPSGRAIAGAYDNGGRLLGMSYPEGEVVFTYADNTDRVSSLTRTRSDGSSQQLSFTYDGSLPTGVTFAGMANGQYRFFYNNDFFVTGYSLDGGPVTSLGRDADGLLTSHGPFTITRSGPAGAPSALTDNTLSIAYAYDSFGRLATRTHTVAGTPVYEMQLAYDDVGRIHRKVETVSGATGTYDYTYDLGSAHK